MPNIVQKLLLLAVSLGFAVPLCIEADAKPKPNILFVITDDIGIDQYTAFGYSGEPDDQALGQAQGRTGSRIRLHHAYRGG